MHVARKLAARGHNSKSRTGVYSIDGCRQPQTVKSRQHPTLCPVNCRYPAEMMTCRWHIGCTWNMGRIVWLGNHNNYPRGSPHQHFHIPNEACTKCPLAPRINASTAEEPVELCPRNALIQQLWWSFQLTALRAAAICMRRSGGLKLG